MDGFRIGARAHAGAMATLYHAHVETGEPPPFPLLMKVPRLGRGSTSEGILSFETERSILPLLHGPHVPKFVAAGDMAHAPYLVMEAIDGQSLTDVIEGKRLPTERIAELGASFADALYDLHQQDAVHLDIKPDNVIVRPEGTMVLIDFGLAHYARLPDLLAEEKRFAAGSAPYVAPEQVLEVRSDARADLFALGVVLYEMATGELPFGAPSTLAGLRDRLWLDPVPPRCIEPSIPPWLQEVILRCLEPQADLRYQSAAHIAFDLRHPEQIELTQRASKSKRAGLVGQLKRWKRARKQRPQANRPANALLGAAQIVLVAVDTTHPADARQPFILRAAEAVLSFGREFRVICVAVVDPAPPGGMDVALVEHRVRLMQWASPLDLPPHRLALHVLEDANPAQALLDFAKANLVDLIVLGAPDPKSTGLAWWRSVASTVTTNARCSVYVVRAPPELP